MSLFNIIVSESLANQLLQAMHYANQKLNWSSNPTLIFEQTIIRIIIYSILQ